MAAVTNGTTNTGYSTSGTPSRSSDLTVCAFFRMDVATTNYKPIAGGSTGPGLSCRASGQSNTIAASSNTSTIVDSLVTPTIGVWYFGAVVQRSTLMWLYWKRVGAPALQSKTGTGAATYATGKKFQIGFFSTVTTSIFQGGISGVRFWQDCALDEGQLELESWSILPVFRPAGCTFSWPLYGDVDVIDREGGQVMVSATPANVTAGSDPLVGQIRRVRTRRPLTAPATGAPPAFFQASYSQPWNAGQYPDTPAANQRIDPATFQPSPSAAFAQPFSAGQYSQSHNSNRQIDPSTFQPSPSALFVQPWNVGAYADSPTLNRRIDPSTFQPAPSAAYSQPWTAGTYAQSDTENRRIDPASFQPNPGAQYPNGAGSAYISGTWTTTFIPTPPAVIAASNYPAGSGSTYASVTWATPFVAPPVAAFVSVASFSQFASVPPRIEANAVSARWINPASFQPNPGAIYPAPWSAGAYAQSVAGFFVATPPVVNPTASYPQRQPDQWHLDGNWATPRWINPATFQPTPSGSFPQPWSAGTYAQSIAGVFVQTPPAVNPTADYPQHMPDQWHAPGQFHTSQRIDPATFQPSPLAVHPQPWSAGTYAQSWSGSFISVAPVVAPTAFYPQPWSGSQYATSSVGAFVAPPPVVIPSALYPQRMPEQWHLDGNYATPKWIDPAIFRPIPSATFVQPWSANTYRSSDVFGSVAIVPITLLRLLAPVTAMDPTLSPVRAK